MFQIYIESLKDDLALNKKTINKIKDELIKTQKRFESLLREIAFCIEMLDWDSKTGAELICGYEIIQYKLQSINNLLQEIKVMYQMELACRSVYTMECSEFISRQSVEWLREYFKTKVKDGNNATNTGTI